MPLRETISWVLQLEGDLTAQVDRSEAAIRELGLGAEETKAKIAALKAEQKATAEQSSVMNKNLLGTVAVIGAVAVGIGMATQAVGAWVANITDADKHLKALGMTTGTTGREIAANTLAMGQLGIAWDKLKVDFSASPLTGLNNLLTVVTKIVTVIDDHLDSIQTFGRVMQFLNTAGGSEIIRAGLGAAAGSSAVAPRTAWNPMGQLDGMMRGPSAAGSNPASGSQYDGIGWGSGAFDPGALANSPLLKLLAKPKAASAPPPAMLDDTWRFGLAPGNVAPSFNVSPLHASGAAAQVALEQAGRDAAYQGQVRSDATASNRASSQSTALSLIQGIGSGNLGTATSSVTTALGAGGPIGAIAGAVVGLAPQLGSIFKGLVKQLEHLPTDLIKGLSTIIEGLPDLLGKTIPALILGIDSMIPKLVVSLMTALPEILISVFTGFFVELPKQFAAAIKDIFTGSGDAARRAVNGAMDSESIALRMTMNPAGFGGTPGQGINGMQSRSGGGGVHVHLHGGSSQDQVRQLRKVLGPYGQNLSLDPLVT